jgi:hypothetical protein
MEIERRQLLMGAMAAAPRTAAPSGMPVVAFGKHELSRLIVGGNPVSANSHAGAALDREMRDYFTAVNVKQMLRRCVEAGINTWQSRADRHIMRLLHEYRVEGGGIQWIAQTASELADIPRNIRDIASMGAIGVYHHGSRTDALWKAGRMEEAREGLKEMRQTGIQVGLGTHVPEVIDYVEDAGWDLDFYMTCVYNLSRPKEEQVRIAGGKLADHELFRDADRDQMLARVKRTRKQCLIFKVYAASRKCGSPQQMEEAMRFVARYAKPRDCLVIGMFPKHREQVKENAGLVRRVFA